MVDHKFVVACTAFAAIWLNLGSGVGQQCIAKGAESQGRHLKHPQHSQHSQHPQHSKHSRNSQHPQHSQQARHQQQSTKPGPSGKASIYSDRFNGKKTASGERFQQSKLTAASPVLPIGSKVKVTNKKTGKSVVVKINDKQAKLPGRVLDLSKSAAHKIGVKDGLAPVSTTVIKK